MKYFRLLLLSSSRWFFLVATFRAYFVNGEILFRTNFFFSQPTEEGERSLKGWRFNISAHKSVKWGCLRGWWNKQCVSCCFSSSFTCFNQESFRIQLSCTKEERGRLQVEKSSLKRCQLSSALKELCSQPLQQQICLFYAWRSFWNFQFNMLAWCSKYCIEKASIESYRAE